MKTFGNLSILIVNKNRKLQKFEIKKRLLLRTDILFISGSAKTNSTLSLVNYGLSYNK